MLFRDNDVGHKSVGDIGMLGRMIDDGDSINYLSFSKCCLTDHRTPQFPSGSATPTLATAYIPQAIKKSEYLSEWD